MAFITIILSIPLAVLLMNKKTISTSIVLISIAIVVTLAFCQFLSPAPRYYIAVYPFIVLGLAVIVPINNLSISVDIRLLGTATKAGLLGITAVIALFLSLSVVLLTNYSDYDVGVPWFTSDESTVYRQTVDYLEPLSPNKVYAANPVYTALSPRLNTTLAFDTFGLLWLKKESPAQIMNDQINSGVDYVVLDSWVRYWQRPQSEELIRIVKQQGSLVQVIAPDSLNRIEIYKLTTEK